MKKDKLIKIIDVVVLIIVAALCGIYTVSGLFSGAKGNKVDYVLICCILLFALALHFIFSIFTELEFFKKQDELMSKVDSLDAIKGVRKFATSSECDAYIAERIALAEKSVCDLNWQDDLPFNPRARDPLQKQFTEKAIDTSIKTFCKKQGRIYREIFTFTYPANIQKMKIHISYGNSYSCAYFENLTTPKFPKMQFVIIDNKEIIFASSAYEPHLYSIHDENFVHMFSRYFDQAWRQSTRTIKEDNIVHEDVIDKIERNYSNI